MTYAIDVETSCVLTFRYPWLEEVITVPSQWSEFPLGEPEVVWPAWRQCLTSAQGICDQGTGWEAWLLLLRT